MHEHRIAMAHHQLLLLPVGLTENGQISENHYGAGYPERNRARYDGIVSVHHKRALLGMLLHEYLVLVCRVPADEDGQEREQRRRYPCVQQHNANHAFCHANRILERLHNGIVSAKKSRSSSSSRMPRLLVFQESPHTHTYIIISCCREVRTYPLICSINAKCLQSRSTRPSCSTGRTGRG